MLLAENILELLKNMLLVRELLNLSFQMGTVRLDLALFQGLPDCSLAAEKARERLNDKAGCAFCGQAKEGTSVKKRQM
jgi:hypothetical protein